VYSVIVEAWGKKYTGGPGWKRDDTFGRLSSKHLVEAGRNGLSSPAAKDGK